MATWDDVGHLLFDTYYPIEDKKYSTPIWRAAIDTGGGKVQSDWDPSMTEQAYWWIRKNMGRGCLIWGTKGSARELTGKVSTGKFLDRMPSGKPIEGGLQLVILDTDKLKDQYHYRLQQAIEGEDQAAYLHKDTEETYARHIMAEEKQLDDKGLQTWVQIRPDNHLFDCEVLNMAVSDPEWIGGGVNLQIMYHEDLQKRNRARKNQNQKKENGFKRPDMSKIRERLNR